jgi:hypothetical protein
MLTELRAIQTGVVQFLSARALYLVFSTLNSVPRDMYHVTGTCIHYSVPVKRLLSTHREDYHD